MGQDSAGVGRGERHMSPCAGGGAGAVYDREGLRDQRVCAGGWAHCERVG
jgi:hypothetical protein